MSLIFKHIRVFFRVLKNHYGILTTAENRLQCAGHSDTIETHKEKIQRIEVIAMPENPNPYNPYPYKNPYSGVEPPPGYPQRSRPAAGVLGILLGTIGVHNFYLGNSQRGLIQLLVSLLTCGIGAIPMYIWGIVEGVQILEGKINADGNGVRLKD